MQGDSIIAWVKTQATLCAASVLQLIFERLAGEARFEAVEPEAFGKFLEDFDPAEAVPLGVAQR